MKQVKLLIAIFGLLLAMPSANAALIDQGDYTYDDVNGLEWLDVSLTTGMSMDAALAAYSADGWVLANQTDYHTMFDSYVTGYVGNASGYMQTTDLTSIQYAEIQAFQNLFGFTYSSGSWFASYGLFLENTVDGDVVRLGGMYDGGTFGNLYRDLGNVYDPTTGWTTAGWFLVRQGSASAASVPEASTLAMFAIGLLGLGFSRRRKA